MSEQTTVTITGTNDAPVITDGPDTADLDETNAGVTASGTLTVGDVDTTDVVTASRTLAGTGTSDRSEAAAPSDAELLAMLTLSPTPILDGTENTATDIYGALLNGASLALAPTGPLTLDAIATAIESHQVTTLWLTSGVFTLKVED